MGYSSEFEPVERTVRFNIPVKDAQCDKNLVKMRADDGRLCAVKVMLRPNETAVITLCD